MFHRVAPRVVSGLIGEPGPELTRHSPVINQVKQAEYTDGCLKVPGCKGAAPMRQGAGPVERGNGVKDIRVDLFGSPIDRGEEFRRDGQSVVFEHAPRISAFAELPYASGQLTETRILHESPVRWSAHGSDGGTTGQGEPSIHTGGTRPFRQPTHAGSPFDTARD